MTDNVQNASLELNVLTPDDEEQLEKLVREVGWGVPQGRLRMMLEIGEAVGHFANGQLVASSILFPYGTTLAFLGMVIVHPALQRRGLGAAVVRKCLLRAAHLGIQSVGLLATDAGHPLYQKLGFVTADHAHRYIGKPTGFNSQFPELNTSAQPVLAARVRFGEHALSIAPLNERDWPEVLTLDSEVSGASRETTYRHFVRTVTHTAVVRQSDGTLSGYAMATKVGDFLMIGPLHAVDMDTAGLLAVYVMQHAEGMVRLDVPSNQTEWMRQLEAWGLVDTHVSPMMLHGSTTFPGRRQWLYGIMDAALG